MEPSYLAFANEKRDFAFEIKFLVSETVAESALAWARKNLEPDPFAGEVMGDGYCVNSVYLDTAGFDVYHRKGSYGRCKYRVRRYGVEPGVFLERKLKTRGLVGKRRTRVLDRDVTVLADGALDRDWIGYWFHRRLIARGLKPKCQIAYDRTARVGSAPDGPIRMTLDRNLRSFPTSRWHVQDTGPWQPLLTNQCIVEMKYRKTLPDLFKRIIEQLGLQLQTFSKYRLSVQTFGWATEQTVAGAAINGQTHPAISGQREAPTLLWAEPVQRSVRPI